MREPQLSNCYRLTRSLGVPVAFHCRTQLSVRMNVIAALAKLT